MDTSNGAYIGYRSAGRRPESQNLNREAAKNTPLAVLRGLASGVLGAPGDIESLIRMLPGLKSETVLPTSEDIERRLPGREVSQGSPLNRAATSMAQLGGGFYTGPGSPLRAVAALPAAVKHGAGEFVRAQSIPSTNVIKQKGGNWLTGSVEEAIEPLKLRTGTPLADLERIWAEQGITDPVRLDPIRRDVGSAEAINRWLDKKLTRYIKNEMATPEDPVRALAERGVLHYEPRTPAPGQVERSMERRVQGGFPAAGYGESDLAKMFETLSDSSIQGHTARDWLENAPTTVLEKMPWINTVPSETQVFEKTNPGMVDDLGFDHLVDELRNAINPESGLPRELLLSPEKLDKVTVPQAVELVDKINKWRAAQKAEADLLRANNAATVLHKEYPEGGYRWVELKAPTAKSVEDLSPEQMSWYEEYVQGGVSPEKALQEASKRTQTALKDALKYEGDTMGHCVGGYCDDVASGKSRIYSLRDAKGQPHVTIEVRPPEGFAGMKTEEDFIKYASEHQPPEVVQDMLVSAREHGAFVPKIVQIKGKQNRAPKEEYLPFVQDFVRSGNWSHVGDLLNTGLRRKVDVFDRSILENPEIKSLPDYFTEQELLDAQKAFAASKKGSGPGYAAGGRVKKAWSLGELYASYTAAPTTRLYAEGGLVDYNPDEVEQLANQLRAELSPA